MSSTINLILSIICIPLFWFLFIFLFKLILKKNNINVDFKNFVILFLTLCSFSILGFASGWLVGLSKSHTISAVMPAIFTFFAGFIAYLFSKEKNENLFDKVLITSIIGSFSLWLIFGAEVGIKRRLHDEIIDYNTNAIKDTTINKTRVIDTLQHEIDIEKLKEELGN